MKPHIDAIDMKAMRTFGKCTALFIFLKFRQTDGAIDGIGVGFGRESENRERVKNRGVQAAVLGDGGTVWGRGVFGFEIEDEAVATAESSTAASSENVPAGVEMKANDEHDDEEKDDDGTEHNLAA